MPLDRSPRIVFFNRFYAPEEPATAQLLTDVAEALAAQGRSVIVVTSMPRGQRLARRERRNNVDVHRVRGTKLGNRNVLSHACDFGTFALASLWRAARLIQRGDTVVLMTDPPLFGVVITALARFRGARVIHWLQDIYPEAAALLSGGRVLSVLTPLRNWSWRASSACVALGSDTARVPREAGVPTERIYLVPNWAPAGIEPVASENATALRVSWGLAGKFVVLYFGNLGRVHDLQPVLDVAERLQHDPAYAFVFIGPGAQRAPLEAEVHARGLNRVLFFPAQPRERRSEVLALGDVHLVTLRAGCERVVYPSKLYSICAARRPILFIGPTGSGIAREIVERSVGRAFSRDDIEQIAGAIRAWRDAPRDLEAFASSARQFYENDGSVAHAIARWNTVLAEVESQTTPEAREANMTLIH